MRRAEPGRTGAGRANCRPASDGDRRARNRRCAALLVVTLQMTGCFRGSEGALGDRLYRCDECQEVCPPNRWRCGRHGRKRYAGCPGRPDRLVSVLGSCASDENSSTVTAAGTSRNDPRYPSNALVIAGQRGDGQTLRCVPLARALAGRRSALRTPCGHARRPVRRSAVDVTGDPDPEVQAEPSSRAREALREAPPRHQRLPPKIGGIQSCLLGAWRLPADEAAVLTTPYEAPMPSPPSPPIRQASTARHAPTRSLVARIDETARLGRNWSCSIPPPARHLGPRLALPYGVISTGPRSRSPDRSGSPPGARGAAGSGDRDRRRWLPG